MTRKKALTWVIAGILIVSAILFCVLYYVNETNIALGL